MTRLVAVLAALAVGILSLVLARRDPAGSFGGASTAGAFAELGAGWSLVAAGILLWIRARPARLAALLYAAGLLWFAREWSNPAIGTPVGFTIGNAFFLSCAPVVAHAALAFPSGRLGSRRVKVALTSAYASAIALLGVLPLTVFEPRSAGCADCPRNLLLIQADPALFDTLNHWGLRVALVSVAALAVAAGWQVSASRVRATTWPALAAAGYLAAVALELHHALATNVLGNDPGAARIWRLEAVFLVATAFAVGWDVARSRRARAKVARLAVELAAAPRGAGLQAALQAAVRDPSLTLAYRRTDGDGYIDAAGRRITVAPGRGSAATPLLRGSSEVGVVIHDERLVSRGHVFTEALAAARLALSNEQLQADVQARLVELTASRARIVAAGDAERQRLERDLHDGAQQRLVGLVIALQLLTAVLEDPADAATLRTLASVRVQVDSALDALREIAHGLYPAVLADAGLQPALEMVAERSPDRVSLGAVVADRLPPTVENVAYFAAVEAAAGAARATISASRQDGAVVVAVDRGESSPIAHERLQEIADRVGATGGRVTVNGGVLRAEVPCEL